MESLGASRRSLQMRRKTDKGPTQVQICCEYCGVTVSKRNYRKHILEVCSEVERRTCSYCGEVIAGGIILLTYISHIRNKCKALKTNVPCQYCGLQLSKHKAEVLDRLGWTCPEFKYPFLWRGIEADKPSNGRQKKIFFPGGLPSLGKR